MMNREEQARGRAAGLAVIALVCLSLLPAVSRGQGSSTPQNGQVPFYSGRANEITRRNPAFEVHPKMRSRVDFWIDVFTKYGKHHAVLHHRMHPGAVFSVLDFREQAKKMSEAALERYRKKVIKKETEKIRTALRHLSSGKAPRTQLEGQIQRAMQPLGRGTAKYRKVLNEKWIRSQRGIRERYAEAIERSGRYMHILEKTFVKDFGLPIELTRLPFVESSFDYKAYSSVGAAGIWQFMPRTGRVYKMRITSSLDERRDIIASTRGAAQYLSDAYRQLGTWPLALTSYNHGVAGVRRKMKKLGTRDIVTIVENPKTQLLGFASQNFYPEFLAALEIYDDIPRYFPRTRPERPLRLAEKRLKKAVTVTHALKELGIDKPTLQATNYALSKRVWSGAYPIPAGYTLKVPEAFGSRLARMAPDPRVQARANATSSVYGGIVYRVRRGDTLGKIARKYRTSVSKLRAYNGLSSDLVKVGQRLVVKPAKHQPSSSSAPKSASGLYTVRSGDTLTKIARRYRTTIKELRAVNNLQSDVLRVGQRLALSKSSVAVPQKKKPVQTMSGTVIHTVKRGDTLFGIAREHRTTVARVRSLNGMKSSRIKVGQKLRVPAFTGGGQSKPSKTSSQSSAKTHRVRPGDTLWSLSRRYGVSVSYIKRLNGLKNSRVKVGQVIRIHN